MTHATAKQSPLAELLAGTPGTMRIFGALAVAGALIFGALGFAAVSMRSSSLATARAEAAQLVRLQRIHTNLVEADANATNAFLVGGLEPPENRAAYEQGIARASATLAEASAHGEVVARALGTVNDALVRYTGLVEAARANNRQGFPVGVAYVKQAHALLQEEILPVLTGQVDRSQRRVFDAYGRAESAASGIWLGAAIALGAALLASGWLAVRTRRVVNLPIAAGAGAIVLASLVALVLMAVAAWKADDVREGAYAESVALSAARIAAFDAKSAESLTLIARGSGEVYDARYEAQIQTAREQAREAWHLGVDGDVVDALNAYDDVHETIRTADETGRWEEAVAIATAPVGDPTSANNRFAEFDLISGRALDRRADTIADDLGTARAPLTGLRWAVLAVAIAAAIAAWRGIGLRLREYQ